MLFFFSPIHLIHYFLGKEANQFFASVAIRKLAVGMILIFEPIYIYLYFNKSLSPTLLFFGAIYISYGLLVVYGGKLMSRIGLKKSILFSQIFFFGYYLSLFLIHESFLLVPLAVILKTVGLAMYYPAFHTDFVRFSQKEQRGREVGELNIARFTPLIISPAIGGLILAWFGYPVLFLSVLILLLGSVTPLFLSRERHEVYEDSYPKAWKRIFKKKNRRTTLAFATRGSELGINSFLWPLFMYSLALEYSSMGEITSLGLGISLMFALYIGKVVDTGDRDRLLRLGSLFTSMAWIIRYFVITPLDVFLGHTFYKISKNSANIPYQTILYEKAETKKEEADEFIIYRAIVHNVSKGGLLLGAAGLFLFTSSINLMFLAGAGVAIGFMFLGKKELFHLWK